MPNLRLPIREGLLLCGELSILGHMRQFLRSRVRSFRYAFLGITTFFIQVNARVTYFQ